MQIETTSRWRDQAVELFLLQPSHVSPAYVGWLNDPQVNRYLESRFARHDLDSTRAFVDSCHRDPKTVFWGMRALGMASAHVGNIKLGPIDGQHRTGDIGILLGEPTAWGRGLARAAISRVADIARHELGLRKLTAGCYASNIGSVKAFTLAGFVVEGRRPAQFLLDNQPEDLIQMGLVLS